MSSTATSCKVAVLNFFVASSQVKVTELCQQCIPSHLAQKPIVAQEAWRPPLLAEPWLEGRGFALAGCRVFLEILSFPAQEQELHHFVLVPDDGLGSGILQASRLLCSFSRTLAEPCVMLVIQAWVLWLCQAQEILRQDGLRPRRCCIVHERGRGRV